MEWNGMKWNEIILSYFKYVLDVAALFWVVDPKLLNINHGLNDSLTGSCRVFPRLRVRYLPGINRKRTGVRPVLGTSHLFHVPISKTMTRPILSLSCCPCLIPSCLILSCLILSCWSWVADSEFPLWLYQVQVLDRWITDCMIHSWDRPEWCAGARASAPR